MFILIIYLFIIGDVSLSVINTTLMIVLKQLLSCKRYVFSLGNNGAPRAFPNIEYQLVVAAKVKRSGTSQFSFVALCHCLLHSPLVVHSIALRVLK